MTPRSPTAKDLAAFAPDACGQGHDLRLGAGNRRVTWTTCLCDGASEGEPPKFGHIVVKCVRCGERFYDPPHTEAT